MQRYKVTVTYGHLLLIKESLKPITLQLCLYKTSYANKQIFKQINLICTMKNSVASN